MTLRVIGIDPGLTRCGVGVVDVAPNRRATLVYVGVVRTPPEIALEERLRVIGEGIDAVIGKYEPTQLSLERVFAQNNLSTVMGTAQASGVAMYVAARRGLSVSLHTPTEVKLAITGFGGADKKQVGTMVARVLGLAEAPTPAAGILGSAAVCFGRCERERRRCSAWIIRRSRAHPGAGGVAVGREVGGCS